MQSMSDSVNNLDNCQMDQHHFLPLQHQLTVKACITSSGMQRPIAYCTLPARETHLSTAAGGMGCKTKAGAAWGVSLD